MTFFEQQHAARAASLRLILAFALTLILLVLAINGSLWLVFWLLSASLHAPVRLPQYFYAVNTGITLLFVLGGWWIESSLLAQGGQVLAARAGARLLQPYLHDDEEDLQKVVEEMALAAQMPMPFAVRASLADQCLCGRAGSRGFGYCRDGGGVAPTGTR